MRKRQIDVDKSETTNLTKIASMSDSMPPDKAGPIVQGLETEFALELLSQMDPKKAAKILSAVSPQKAVELAKRLSEKKPLPIHAMRCTSCASRS